MSRSTPESDSTCGIIKAADAEKHGITKGKTQRSIEKIGFAFVIALAFMTVGSAIAPYVLPTDLHLRIANALYGSYATDQLPVLADDPVTEFVHRIGGSLYLVLAILQFVSKIRSHFRQFHRWSGRILIALSVGGAVSGLIMVTLYPFAGIEQAIPTYLFGGIFLISYLKGFYHARRGEIVLHREWMIRGFSIGVGVASIRLVYLAGQYLTDLPDTTIFLTAFWLGWSLSLITGEVWINITRPWHSGREQVTSPAV